MSHVWFRRHNIAGSGVSSLDAGWALWGRQGQQPWPRDEMGPGFRYYICEPAGGRDRQVRVHATVTKYLPFVQVDSLGDAYEKVEPVLAGSGMGLTQAEWISNEYNVEKVAQGRWPLWLAFWVIEAEAIEAFRIDEIMDFRPGQTGWKKVSSDRLPVSAQ